MQSFSVQKMAQSEGTLATLADVPMLPAGWSFRTRTLEKDLSVIVTPDTILGWYRKLVAAKYDGTGKRGRQCKAADVRALVVRMARENPRWGYSRIVGAMKSLGHELGRNTVKRILTAFFLIWLDGQFSDSVYQLNLSMRGDDGRRWSKQAFAEITGETVDRLWERYQASF